MYTVGYSKVADDHSATFSLFGRFYAKRFIYDKEVTKKLNKIFLNRSNYKPPQLEKSQQDFS